MRLAILGYGSVAKALLPLLRADQRFEVGGIHSRSRPAAAWFEDFLDQSGADTLVEVTTLNPATGEPAITHIRAAFERGMHVVTSNKGPIAHAYRALADEAERRGLCFRFESSVMDGTPVFNQFRYNMPGVKVLGFTGVLNSTTKLVIETMENGGTFDDGLAHARTLGVAEANASHDTKGLDSAAKTAALANVLMDARVTPRHVETEGIHGLTPERIRALAADGKTVRLVSRALLDGGRLQLRVSPEVLDKRDVLASGEGTSNLLLFHTDRMGTFGTISIGPQVEQTAYGVYIDLNDVLASIESGKTDAKLKSCGTASNA